MTTATSRRGNFFAKDSGTPLESVKTAPKDIISGRDSKYDQENLPNGIKNGVNTAIPESYVGYSNIPNHAFRRAVRNGFDFNLMVIGESGIGKSTFVNTLFLTDIYSSEHPGPSRRAKSSVEVCTTTVLLQEDGVALRLSVIDIPGFGECIDNTECWKPIVEHLDARFDEYMTNEGLVNRNSSKLSDSRVHACLYFLAPTGHRLKSLDIECLKRIQDKVNVIPIIGKADCLTPAECTEFKKNILADLQKYNIKIYNFIDSSKGADAKGDQEKIRMKSLCDRIPFAVVGANTFITNSSGSKVRARTYPWGTVEVDNVEHNDFAVLSYYLIQLQMQNLREVTHRVHYENYRASKLCGIAEDSNFKTGPDGKDPMMLMDAEKREHEVKLGKMKADMETVFAQKVAEKSQKLKEIDADLSKSVGQMEEQLRTDEAAYEADRRAFEDTKAKWEEAWREWDIGAELTGSGSSGLLMGGLGERVLSEVIKERSKTEKKRKGLF